MNDTLSLDADPYFTSIRLLVYQLLHDPQTRSRDASGPVPVVVLTLPSVPAVQVEVLKTEGATITPVEPVDLPPSFHQDWVNGSRFRDVLAKLRVWQLTQYDRVLVLDADTVVTRPLDGVFSDPQLSTSMTALRSKGSSKTTQAASTDEPPVPSKYLLAASTDTWGSQDHWISSGQPDYLCACFMLLQPSSELFNYYKWLLSRPEPLFEAAFPDQDLLIYAHRPDGPLPWRRIPVAWSANDGNFIDRSRSVHVKAWKGAQGANIEGQGRVQDARSRLLQEMVAFYQSRQH